MMTLYGLLFALALSIDGFIVGVHYGMRRVRLPLGSLLVIASCTAAGMALSMFAGGVLAADFARQAAETAGGAVLIFIGLWQLGQAWVERVRRVQTGADVERSPGERRLASFRVPFLGVVVEIIADPIKADKDRSGVIEFREAAALGAVLGVDALGAGFAAAMLGFPPTLIALVAGAIAIFVSGGVRVGRGLKQHLAGDKWLFLPGLILVAIGIAHL